jgi:hypothetical protein
VVDVEPELAALASAAGTAVVSLLATDAWTALKAGLAAVWGRVHPDRADTVAAELAEARQELVAARAVGDREAEHMLTVEWQVRLRRLLAADPGAAVELRRLLFVELNGARAAADRGQIAVATGGSVVSQAGRDLTITSEAGRAGPPSRRPPAPPRPPG